MNEKKITANIYKKMFAEYPDIVGLKDVRKMLGIGKNKAYHLVNTGELPKLSSYRSIKILKLSVIEYVIRHL